MSNDEKKIQPIFQILHIKSAWFFLELAMALVTTIGMRFLQVCRFKRRKIWVGHGNLWAKLWEVSRPRNKGRLWQILISISTLSSIGASKNSPFSGHQGKFLTGPTVSLKLTPDEVNSLRIPKVFIPYFDGIKECHFLVYHAIQSTMCLLIPAEVDFTVDFFRYVITTSVFIYTTN